MRHLILYSRQGCCLCEGLEQRLRELLPSGGLDVVDVDGDPELQARYGLMVPVLAMAVAGGQPDHHQWSITPLPPVPPRLQGDGLRKWLERHNGLLIP